VDASDEIIFKVYPKALDVIPVLDLSSCPYLFCSPVFELGTRNMTGFSYRFDDHCRVKAYENLFTRYRFAHVLCPPRISVAKFGNPLPISSYFLLGIEADKFIMLVAATVLPNFLFLLI